MILEIDIGNSRIKWRVLDAHGAALGAGAVADLPQLLAVTVEVLPVARVRIACVRPGDLLKELVEELAQRRRLPVEQARVERFCQGVTVGYRDPARLGVDRWLTLLAAFRQAPGAAIVVDCGTAVTVDLLDEQGQHQGGYIVPGLRLGPLALTRDTAIRLSGQPQWEMTPGQSTEDAIYHGALCMVTGLLEKVIARSLPSLSADGAPVLFLTGGDAPLIRQFLDPGPLSVREAPELVFDGLAIALP